jgi:hypothetical protein
LTVTGRVADLQIQQIFDIPDPAEVGENVQYTVQVATAASTKQTVTGATLLLNFQQAAFVSSSDAACFSTQLGVTCPLPALPPGTIHGLDVTLLPNAELTQLNVTALVNAPVGTTDPDQTNNLGIATTTIGSDGTADLSVISLSESADPIAPGQPVTYQATLQNFGPHPVTTAVVHYQMFSNVTAGPLQPGCTNTSSPVIAAVQITCAVGAISAQGVSAAPSATFIPQLPGVYTVWADPGSAATDPNPANNRFTTTVTVTAPSADLRVDRIDDSPDPVAAGGDVTYSVDAISMLTSQPVVGAVLRVLFTGNAQLKSSSSSCAPIAGGVGCPLGTLLPGLVNTVQPVMTLPTPGQVVGAQASIVAPAGVTDSDPTNNTLSASTTVQSPTPGALVVG